MNIHDVAMVDCGGIWFTVTGFDYLHQVWIVMVYDGDKDHPYVYRQACISDANVLQYMDRAGNTNWGVLHE